MGLRVFCFGNQCFFEVLLGLVFFARVGRRCFLLRSENVFCRGRRCFWHLERFSATVIGVISEGSVFCDGNQCFLRWPQGGGL